jgi:hypothetical protein
LFDSAADVMTIVDPKDAAESAGLRYVSDARPGISRRKSGKGFTYIRADGSKLSEAAVLRRIKALPIPPACLAGRLFDDRGNRMSPTHANKRGVRYRYYVSHAILQNRKAEAGSIARVPAPAHRGRAAFF